MTKRWPLAALLLLASCGEEGTTVPKNVAAQDNGYTARMAALNEGERNVVLFRAIHDAGRAAKGSVALNRPIPSGGSPRGSQPAMTARRGWSSSATTASPP